MKRLPFDPTTIEREPIALDTELSFEPFIAYIRQRAAAEEDVKAEFLHAVLKRFDANPTEAEKVKLVYACQSPTLIGPKESVWGLCIPLKPAILYATEGMLDLLEQNKAEILKKDPEKFRRDRLQQIYAFILRRLYDFDPPVRTVQYHAYTNAQTGLLQYYVININTDFIEVEPVGELPPLDFSRLHHQLAEGEGYESLEHIIPLQHFRFRGLSMITITDVTAQYAVENIRQVRLTRTPGEDAEAYQKVIHSLKTLVGDSRMQFDLFPFQRVNGKPVYGFVKGGTGILFEVWGEASLTSDAFERQASSYYRNPNSFYSPDIRNEDLDQFAFLKKFIALGVRSLALRPVFYNNLPVGVLCMHTWQDATFDEKKAGLLEPVIGPIAQLFQVYIDEFNLELDNVVKEQFTPLQPAVQWKFNEAAWQYLRRRKKQETVSGPDPVMFNDVYPLYGAIDIRNSSAERNEAIRSDLENQLQLLSETFSRIGEEHSSSLLEGMSFACRNWQQALATQSSGTLEEGSIHQFLQEEVRPFLEHTAGRFPQLAPMIGQYLQSHADTHKAALESDMQLLNAELSHYLDTEKDELQQSYPCYFEKFRTDGLEYDIYIGQSIAPGQPFSPFHLKNVRLWQLSSMAQIARMTHALLPKMRKGLETTQLIFVHNQPIDISFRTDERKFDVEGAYNIRYQMIKKRIDKVHILNTTERLTQPGAIAVIYFTRKDIEDYLQYIPYLQEKGMIHTDVEDLQLEELQGLSGLRALRLKVLYE
ncbi:GAF domain-containing protein [Chitinophaga lutea]